jgi:hypothetical protein
MPSPRKDEIQDKFINRCMSDEEAKRSFPDGKQRVAFCHSQWSSKGENMENKHLLNKMESEFLKSQGDEDAGYPPNCNEGYVEKDGKCVPIEDNE